MMALPNPRNTEQPPGTMFMQRSRMYDQQEQALGVLQAQTRMAALRP
jgi:hypothetical protein